MNNDVLKRYTEWCRDELFSDELKSGADLMQVALDNYLLIIYERLFSGIEMDEFLTPQELVSKLGFVESADITLDAMLERLSTKFDFVSKSTHEGQAKYKQTGEIPGIDKPIEDIRRELAALGEDFVAPLEFLDFGNEKFEYSLKDDPDYFDKMLSGRESENQELWFRATNVDPLQNVHGIMGAEAINLLFEKGTILEIGGGTGNGIRNLLRLLAANGELDRVENYVFTDISAKFIMSTRHEMRKDYPGLNSEWRFVDLNNPLEDQKIEPESVDLIYAVNAAHVAKDIVAFLKSCRKILCPGGRVLFAERIRISPRDMAPRELALNLSVYHRTAANRNEDYRPMHCYLSPENWLKVFQLAGFSDGQILPDFDELKDDFKNQYAAVVTAVR